MDLQEPELQTVENCPICVLGTKPRSTGQPVFMTTEPSLQPYKHHLVRTADPVKAEGLVGVGSQSRTHRQKARPDGESLKCPGEWFPEEAPTKLSLGQMQAAQ